MAVITPFRALRPKPELAAQVAAPPYDVVSLEEARQQAKGNPYSFLRIGRAELELDNDVDPYSPAVYEHGAKNLQQLIQRGVLTQEARPMFGVYRQKWGAHEQTGLVALASVEEYDQGRIKSMSLPDRSKKMIGCNSFKPMSPNQVPCCSFSGNGPRWPNGLRG